MTSNPSSPLCNRRHITSHGCEHESNISRIPLPTPGHFQRSSSLRLRGSKSCTNNLTEFNNENEMSKRPLSSSTAELTAGVSALSINRELLSPSNYLTTSTTSATAKESPAISPASATFEGDTLRTDDYCDGDRTNKDTNCVYSYPTITAELNCMNCEGSHSRDSSIKVSNGNLKVIDENGDATFDTVNIAGSSPTEKSAFRKREHHGMSLNLNGPSTSNCNSSGDNSRTPKSGLHTPKTPISISLGKCTPKTPPVTPDSANLYLDDELESVYSYSSVTSGRSTMSCEHPYVARNGTTFSGRKMKYVVHCSSYAGQVGEDYLTPTQRAQRQLRRLKELLTQARQDLEQKDSEILRLTREVVELRLFKASLSSPEDRSNSSDAVTVREATTELKTSQDVSPIVDLTVDAIKSSPKHMLHHHHGIHQVQFMEKLSSAEMQSSFADSGHFEDLTTSSIHSKDSFVQTHDRASGSDNSLFDDQHREELMKIYEKRIEELIASHNATETEIKRSHNDKIEALLQKLAECNSRYADIVPDHEQAKERIRELEKQLEDLQRKLQEQEDKQNKMYLQMYTKGQEAERMAHADKVLEFAHRAPSRVSVPELLQQLQSTQDELENIRASNCRSERGNSHALLTAKEAISLWVLGARKTIYRRLMEAQQNKTKVDPEVTLQFLKSAIYYFLTDKENSQGHLNAIESILEFSEQEKYNINKARSPK